MMKLMKFVKPYRWMLLLAVALIFGQVNLDLALPDYLSHIVNTGIQQGGVEDSLPQAMRAKEMDHVLVFLDGQDQDDVRAAYTLADKSSPDYETYLKKYPALANEPVYVRNDISQEEINRLNPIMAKALLTTAGLEKALADPEAAAKMGEAMGGFDLSKLPPGTDLFDVLAKLPPEKTAQISASFSDKFSALGDTMMTQAGINIVRQEYEALGMDTEKLQNNYILTAGGWMLLLTLLSGISTVFIGFLAAKIAAGMARDIRRALFQRVESFSSAEFDKFSTASLITRTTNDVTQIQMVSMMMIRMMFYAPLMGIGGILKVLANESPLAWMIGVAVALIVSLIAVVFTVSLPKFKAIQKLTDRINLVARENLTGMMVVRAFTMENFEEKRFDVANKDLTAVSLFINRVMVIMMPLMMLIMNGVMLATIWFGANQIAASNMQVGDMMAFMQYAMQIMMAFVMLSMMFIIIPRASVSAERIDEALATEPHIHDPQTPVKFPEPFKGEIEFRNVSFRYPGGDIDAIQNVSFTAKPGQTTALIGSTGSGKSTIVNLIPRFYEVSDGSIFIDGVDIRDVTQHDLRAKIGYVPQKSALFSGTIESNLRYADKHAADSVLQSAIDIAQAREFVDEKPEGLQTEIAQGGGNVSGGQKQRLSIARAVVKQPPIYILDDSFSALDFKTDSALRRAFKEKSKDSALLIVTQRVSTVKNAEQILVLDNGRIVGKGTHNELMENCETYKEIALSQLNLEELA
ncbi:MAG: ABC transporter ATP-binding protein/permease [Anaerolineales bacterium]|nr:ABC transporter ATP-binding protein/permease [Anaerolineales bacterium]